MKKYFWLGIHDGERIKAISEVTRLVNRYGTVLNLQKSSDISLSLFIGIEERYLLYLQHHLKKTLSMEVPISTLQIQKQNALLT